MWNRKNNPMDRADYKETIDNFESLKQRVEKIDARSERKLFDLKDGFSICYFEYADDAGIHLTKYLPCGDVRKGEEVLISSATLALEGLSHLPAELEKAPLNLILWDELHDEIYISGINLRKTGNKMGIAISGPDSPVKAMYQAQQLKEQIEDSYNPDNNFGKFYGQVRSIGRSGKFKRLLAAFGVQGLNGSRRSFKEVTDLIERVNNLYPELGECRYITGTSSIDGIVVIVEFENEIDNFYEASGGMQGTPCYCIWMSDTADFKNAVYPAFAIGEFIASFNQVTEVKNNESYLRSFLDARETLINYVKHSSSERFADKIFDAKSCIEPFKLNELVSNDQITAVRSVCKESTDDIKSRFMQATITTEEDVRISMALTLGEILKYPNTLKKLQAQQMGMGLIYMG